MSKKKSSRNIQQVKEEEWKFLIQNVTEYMNSQTKFVNTLNEKAEKKTTIKESSVLGGVSRTVSINATKPKADSCFSCRKSGTSSVIVGQDDTFKSASENDKKEPRMLEYVWINTKNHVTDDIPGKHKTIVDKATYISKRDQEELSELENVEYLPGLKNIMTQVVPEGVTNVKMEVENLIKPVSNILGNEGQEKTSRVFKDETEDLHIIEQVAENIVNDVADEFNKPTDVTSKARVEDFQPNNMTNLGDLKEGMSATNIQEVGEDKIDSLKHVQAAKSEAVRRKNVVFHEDMPHIKQEGSRKVGYVAFMPPQHAKIVWNVDDWGPSIIDYQKEKEVTEGAKSVMVFIQDKPVEEISMMNVLSHVSEEKIKILPKKETDERRKNKRKCKCKKCGLSDNSVDTQKTISEEASTNTFVPLTTADEALEDKTADKASADQTTQSES